MPETTLIPGRLDTLLPPSVAADHKEAAHELVRAVLIRSTYLPGVRHRLGWSGIHEAVTPGSRPGSITAKINSRPGVFALHPIAAPEETGRFSLLYFPAPDEEILESFSIDAGICALAPDFIDKVRQFVRHPELMALFHIGFIEAQADGQGVFLSVSACERLGWRSQAGILIHGSDGPVQAVEPGGIDQDLKALDIALDFFSPLAASFTYTLASGPSIFYTQKQRAAPRSALCLSTLEHRWTTGYFSRKKMKAPGWENTRPETVWDPSKPIPHGHEIWWAPNLTDGANSLDKKSMGITDKPRLILLTGFLGSGKTSFLDHFIQAQTRANHFVAVVQNEIGEKGLDARLLDQTYAVTEMDEGCVCCSLAGNLRSALSDIMNRFQPDFIVLETTGLANPANILREIDELTDILEFGSITTIVDSRAGSRALDRFEVARDQVRLADVILINKCDLVDTRTRAQLKTRLQGLNPTAEIHQTTHGEIHPAILYGVNFRNPARRPLFSAMEKQATHEKDRIETRLIHLDAPLEEHRLLGAIQSGGEQILRVKGIAEFKGHAAPMVFQYAPGTCRISEFSGPDKGDRFLVVIGQDLETHFDPGSMGI